MCGGAGSGKSDAILMAACQYLHKPNYNALILRRAISESKLSSAIYDRAQQWFWPFIQTGEVKWNKGEHSFQFPSGARLTISFLRTELDHMRYQCFHPNTELLTISGWKNIKDIVLGELVASMNPETRVMEYKPVTKLHKYHYQGDMYSKDSREVGFCVTPNHEVWFSTQRSNKLKKSRIDALPAVAKLPQVCLWTGVDPVGKVFTSDGNNGKSIEFNPKVWAEFLGWWIAEGNCDLDKWAVVVTQVKKSGRKELKKLYAKINTNKYIDAKRFIFNNKSLVLWLHENCGKGAKNKHLPQEVKQWSSAYLEILLKALVKGDGTWKSSTNGVFVTSSKQLAEDVSEIAVKCGYRPTTKPYTMIGFGKETPGWRVSLTKLDRDTLIKNSTVKETKSQTLQQIPYSGDVHCVTVPPHHTVLTRYNGKVVWMGQSTEFDFIGLEELTTFEDFQYTFMFRSLRQVTGSDIPLRMRSSTNPIGPGVDWVRRRFRITWDDELGTWVGKHPYRKILQAFYKDNPSLDPSYIYSLNEMDPVTRTQMRDGDWSTNQYSRFKPENFDDRYETRGQYFSALKSRKTWHKDTVEIFFTVDPAGTQRSLPGGLSLHKNKGPAWSVVCIWAKTSDNYLLLLDMIRKQCEIPELLQRLVYASQVYKPLKIIAERNGLGLGVTQVGASLGLPIDEIYTSVDKVKNATNALFRASKGMILLPDDAPWLDDFENEVLTWMGAPNETDDIVDNVSNAANYVQQCVGGDERQYYEDVYDSPLARGHWNNGLALPNYEY
jgi:predicted phage terminase large subunit-like protein